jgi:hypothetical protein
MEKINVGDKVLPKSPGGLCLATVASTGEFLQKRDTSCIFVNEGIVIEVKDIIIDYSSWPDNDYEKLGKILYRNCKVKCCNGVGWAGEGALVKVLKED